MVAINSSATGRISLSSDSVQANGLSSFSNLSGDGRYVVYQSDATNLVTGDTNGVSDVFLRDTLTGLTRQASLGTDGNNQLGSATDADVSNDGRFVVFSAVANIITVTSAAQVQMRDMNTGILSTISVSSDEVAGDGASSGGRISADGRYVSFESDATNLVTGDTNVLHDIFLRDTLKGTTSLVSVSSAEVQGNGASRDAEISLSGRYVVFTSDATNLAAGDTNLVSDVFLRDTLLGTTARMSVATAGAVQGNGSSSDAQVSADGRYVVFQSQANNLVAGDTNGTTDVFVRDMLLGTTTRASVDTGGAQLASTSIHGDISADGRYVVFESFIPDVGSSLVFQPGGIFLHDMVANTTICLSVGLGGITADSFSSNPAISDDGRYVTFHSFASNLAAGDSNGTSDVFRVSLQASDAGDWMVGSDGNDTIDGLGGSDILTGGAGSDTLTGGLDEDELQGGAGNDVLRGSEGGDIIDGGAGTDAAMYSESTVGVTISLAAGTGVGGNAQGDVLISIETVYGGLGNDTLVGSVGNDGLVGGAGNDVLRGLAGKDTLIGGAGADRFFYAAPGDSPVGANADVIADFSHAQADKLDLAAMDANSTVAGDQAFAFIGAAAFTNHAGEVRFAASGGNTIVSGDVNGDGVADFNIVLTGAITLVAADFTL